MSSSFPPAQPVTGSSPGPVAPVKIPHWVLEIIAILVGVGGVTLQHNPTYELVSTALAGGGLSGLVHDML